MGLSMAVSSEDRGLHQLRSRKRGSTSALGVLLAAFGTIFVVYEEVYRCPIGRFAAFPSFFIIYILSFIIPGLVPAIFRAIWPWTASAPYVGLLVAVPLCLWIARALARFLLRAFPVRASGKIRWLPIVFCLIGVQFTIGLVWEFLAGGVSSTHPDLYIQLCPPCTWLFAFLIVLWHHTRGRTRRPGYVLFLRTFLSFSDRSMIATLLSIVRGKHTVALLTTPRSNAGSWDLFTICFRGNPICSLNPKVPSFLVSRNEDWQSSIREMMDECGLVIIDVSDVTPGVEVEISMIQARKAPEEVIWLYEGGLSEAKQKLSGWVGPQGFLPDQIVAYKRSYKTGCAAVLLGLTLSVLMLGILPVIVGLQGADSISVVDSIGHAIGRMIGWLCPGTVFFMAVFLRKGVDSKSRRRLRALVAQTSTLR
jgi:hypothetical protein